MANPRPMNCDQKSTGSRPNDLMKNTALFSVHEMSTQAHGTESEFAYMIPPHANMKIDQLEVRLLISPTVCNKRRELHTLTAQQETLTVLN